MSDEEDNSDFFVDEFDIIREVGSDEEELPDADDGTYSVLDESGIIHEVASDEEELPDADDGTYSVLDESGIIHEVASDEEELPDADDGTYSVLDEPDIIHEVTSDEEELPDADDDEIYDSLQIFTRHTGELYSVACSPTDKSLVATGGGDDKGFLWKINQGDSASELNGHEDSVSSLAFSYDGKLLASGGLDGVVQVWDAFGNLKGSLEGPGGDTEWLRWHPTENLLLAGFKDSNVWMWDADKLVIDKMFVGHGRRNKICTGSDDASLRIWNSETGESIHVVQGDRYHAKGLTCLAINSTSTLALTGSKVINTLDPHSRSIECVAFAPSHSWAAVGSMYKKMIIWDLKHLSDRAPVPRSICEHEDGVLCLVWLDTSYVAIGCKGGIVRLWNSWTGECDRTFRGHSEGQQSVVIQSLSLFVDGDHLVLASMDFTAHVFEVKDFH